MPLTLDNTAHFNATDTAIEERDGVCEVAFAADPHGGPETLWFCFRLLRQGPTPARTVLRLKHSGNMLGGSAGKPAHLRPVLRSAGEEEWRRLDPPLVHLFPDGRRDLLWTIDTPADYVEVAWCYPYGRGDVDALIIDTRLHADTIGVSQAARPIVRLSNDYGREGSPRPGLYLIARQHSGETPGSWVLDGFLRHTTSLGEEAPLVWCVPLSNIDGVEQGDYGKDNFPYDLNRAWGQVPMRHETLVIQRDISRWKQRCRPMLAIDFHAPGACENDGLYAYLPNPEPFAAVHARCTALAETIRQALGPAYAARDFARTVNYRSRWETPTFTRALAELHQLPAISFEVPYALIGDHVLTCADYRTAGQRIARAVVQFAAAGEPR